MTKIQRQLLMELDSCSGEGLWLTGARINCARQLRFMGFATLSDLGGDRPPGTRWLCTIKPAGRDQLRLDGASID